MKPEPRKKQLIDRDMSIYKSIYLILFLQLPVLVLAQIKNKGIPFTKNYPRNAYNAGSQSWKITQDNKGKMYFANNSGILSFDGNNWDLLPTPNNSIMRCIEFDDKGNLYAGYFNDFAILKRDSSGSIKFVSLLDKLPKNSRDFGEIWKIYSTPQGIFFQSFTAIFYLINNHIEIIKPKNVFQYSFYANKCYFIQDKGFGLCELIKGKLELLPTGELLADIKITSILPLGKSSFLIATLDHGLYVFDGHQIKKWDIPINAFLVKNQIFTGAVVADKFFALGTIRNGLLIIDDKGKPIQFLNTSKGLSNNTILSINTDKWGNLWLGLDKGIDFVETCSPFSQFNEGIGLSGSGYCALKSNNKLYIGTNQGVYCRPWGEYDDPLSKASDFELVDNSQGQVWSLMDFQQTILCGHDKGAMQITGNKANLIKGTEGTWTFLQPKESENTLLAGTYNGLLKLKRNGNAGYQLDHKVSGFDVSCSKLIEDKDGNIWMSHGYNGIYRLQLDKTRDRVLHDQLFNSPRYFKSSTGICLNRYKDDILFSASDGTYTYDPKNDKFIEYDWFSNATKPIKHIQNIFFEPNDNILFFHQNELAELVKRSDDKYEMEQRPFYKLKDKFILGYENLSYIDSHNVLISSEAGYIHYDPSFAKDYSIPWYVSLHSVEATDKQSGVKVLLSNYINDSIDNIQNNKNKGIQIAYSSNNLKFNFSAVFFEENNKTSYQYYLKGYDEDWSDWSTNKSKEYTGLREGRYTFYVRAKNYYQQLSVENSFSFTIRPPWYRTIFAYMIYFALSILLSFAFAKYFRFRIKQQKRIYEIDKARKLKQQELKFAEEALLTEKELLKLKQEKVETEKNLLEQKKQLQLHNEELRNEHFESEKEILRLKQEKMEAEISHKSKELASLTLNISYKNEILIQIMDQLKEVILELKTQKSTVQLKNIITQIERDLNIEDDWKQFELHFDEVHENFLKRLQEKYPTLKPPSIRLCAYIRMKMSNKQIASLMKMSVENVSKSRLRLKEKLGVSEGMKLTDFIDNF